MQIKVKTEISIEIEACPFCKNGALQIASRNTFRDMVSMDGFYAVFCPSCEAEGPISKNEKSAVDLWNNR